MAEDMYLSTSFVAYVDSVMFLNYTQHPYFAPAMKHLSRATTNKTPSLRSPLTINKNDGTMYNLSFMSANGMSECTVSNN